LLSEGTPDHTVFTRARKKIGTDLLSKLFESLRNQLKAQGFMNEVFTFVDASHLIAKASLWEERCCLHASHLLQPEALAGYQHVISYGLMG